MSARMHLLDPKYVRYDAGADSADGSKHAIIKDRRSGPIII